MMIQKYIKKTLNTYSKEICPHFMSQQIDCQGSCLYEWAPFTKVLNFHLNVKQDKNGWIHITSLVNWSRIQGHPRCTGKWIPIYLVWITSFKADLDYTHGKKSQSSLGSPSKRTVNMIRPMKQEFIFFRSCSIQTSIKIGYADASQHFS